MEMINGNSHENFHGKSIFVCFVKKVSIFYRQNWFGKLIYSSVKGTITLHVAPLISKYFVCLQATTLVLITYPVLHIN